MRDSGEIGSIAFGDFGDWDFLPRADSAGQNFLENRLGRRVAVLAGLQRL